MDIGYLGAFLGGLLSLLSPCSAILLPAFFAYAFSNPATLLTRTGVFYLGLITTLVPLGVFAGTVGAFLSTNRMMLLTIVAVGVIIFGTIQIAGVSLPGLSRTDRADTGSPWTVYVLGAAYGIAGVCTGPILGSVLMIAAVGANPVYGAILLAIYAVGMALPLLLLALVWKRWATRLRKLLTPRTVRIGRWQNTWHALIAGGLSVLLGVLLLVAARDPEIGGILPIAMQYQLETGVAQIGRDIPNLIILVAAAVVAAAVAALRWRKRHPTRADGTAPPKAANSGLSIDH